MSIMRPLFQTGSSDYGFINARVRAIKSRLLGPTQIQELLASPSLADAAEVLKNSDYNRYFHLLSNTVSIQTLEEVLRRHLSDSAQFLMRLLADQPKVLLNQIISYWDMETLRVLIRAKHAQKSQEEILASVLPLGRLSEALIEELAKSENVIDLIQILYIWKFPFSRTLLKTFPDYQATKNLWTLENALEKDFFRNIESHLTLSHESIHRVGNFLLELKDLYNVRSALRILGTQQDLKILANYFLGNGLHMKRSHFFQIALSDSLDQACAVASSSLRLPQKAVNPLDLERKLEHRLFRKAIRSWMGDPLSFDVVFGFLWLQVNEVRNLRIILRSKASFIKPDLLIQELIYA